jgi:hypothetical protein
MKTIFLLFLTFVCSLATHGADENTNSLVQPDNRLAVIQKEYAEAEAAYYKATGTTGVPEDLRKRAGTFCVLLPHGRDE